jgi:hypothetical protein
MASIWFGGFSLIVAGLLEFVLGNTFPFIVFMGYGAHFLVFGTTFIPFFNALSAYTTSNPYETGSQMQTPAFQASFGKPPLSFAKPISIQPLTNASSQLSTRSLSESSPLSSSSAPPERTSSSS